MGIVELIYQLYVEENLNLLETAQRVGLPINTVRFIIIKNQIKKKENKYDYMDQGE
jgi:hypothetical protein